MLSTMVIFSDSFLPQHREKMVPKGFWIRKTELRVLFLVVFSWWTFVVVEASISDQNVLERHNHYPKIKVHRHVPPMPTAAERVMNDAATVSSLSSPSYRYTSPPTRMFYKTAATVNIQNGSTINAPIMRRKPPPNINPWYTLYRPSLSPQYLVRTSKPVEPSWKPAHMVLDEVPRIPVSRLQESNSKHHPPKDYYKHLYGTHEGVKHLKGHYGPSNLSEAKSKIGISQDLEDVRLANEHFLRMRSSGRCRVPAPEVVCVKDVYPNPSKEYLPRCTLLHRCGDRSGCCDSKELSCMARAVQEVALNFYIVHVGLPASHVGLENSVEKLFFTNHTECECVLKPVSSTTTSSTPPPAEYEAETLVKDDPPLQDNEKELRLNEIDDEGEEDSEELRKTLKCRDCPQPYYQRQYPDGRCGCDCFDRQKPCLRIKRGREALPDHEKRCVESNQCDIPECEYGTFITSAGRCPKKPEDFQKPGKNNHGTHNPRSLHNPHHRWTYFERD